MPSVRADCPVVMTRIGECGDVARRSQPVSARDRLREGALTTPDGCQIVIQHAKQSGMHWTVEHPQDNVAGDNRWSHPCGGPRLQDRGLAPAQHVRSGLK
jgi:hypothetical protein